MQNPVVAGLCNGQVLESKLLATVTGECVVIRDPVRQSHTVVALSEISCLKRITTTHPALLVIAAALFLISAAAFSSKQGSGAGVPVALLGTACVAAYLLSRSASVAFVVGSTGIETASGSLSQAAALIAAVQAAQACLESEKSGRPYVDVLGREVPCQVED